MPPTSRFCPRGQSGDQEAAEHARCHGADCPPVTGDLQANYDLLVVGSGPAGEKAAAQAAYFGRRAWPWSTGPVPGGEMVASAVATKAMREAALYLTGFTRHEVYGVSLNLDPQAVIDRLRTRAADVGARMSDEVAENLRRHHVDLVQGTARLGPDRTLVVAPADGGPSRVLRGDAILLATGSRPFHPPGIPFDDPDVLDSESARELDRPLASLVVVGGGAVACEYASIFLALGAEVTLIDRGHQLLPFLDAAVSDLLAESFCCPRHAGPLRDQRGRGVPGRRRARVDIAPGDPIRPEKIVFATGRTGNTGDLGLEEAGVDARTIVAGSWSMSASAPRPRASTPPGTYRSTRPGLGLHGAGAGRRLLRHGHSLQRDGRPSHPLRRLLDSRVRHGGPDRGASQRRGSRLRVWRGLV